MIKVADYLARRLAQLGARHVFMITGGGAMHLNDAFGYEPALKYTCNHHEQACAMAAEGYARVAGIPAIVNVTTGPGGINALNGVFGAWTDSIPMVVVSGQVKRETCMAFNDVPGLRQLGDQEADLIAMVKGITKYAALVREPESIRYHIERAWHLAVSGRPGPTWVDVPIDVQAAKVDETNLKAYDPAEDTPPFDHAKLAEQCRAIVERLKASQRPVIMAGTGVRLAGGVEAFEQAMEALGIPAVTAWTAHDLIPTDHPCFCGRPGSIGDRAGNFTAQNADLLLVVGSRLNVRQVSYSWKCFARCAYKIQVDIDPAELVKPTVKPDLPVVADAKDFLETLTRELKAAGWNRSAKAEWLDWCRARVRKYPWVLERHRDPSKPLNPYHFIDELFQALTADDMVVCGDGSACVVPFQAAAIKRGQRLWCNSGDASMGYDLPAAVGAAVARQGKRVICLAGDGSVQLNLQELQTIVHNRLPVKIFVLNNNGYLSMRQTQKGFFGRFVGEGPASGVSFPDMVRLGEAYGLPSARVERGNLAQALDRSLRSDGPFLCEVMLDPEQPFEPKLSSRQLPDGRMVSSPLEDLAPFLDREELRENLLIPPMPE